MKTPSVVAPTIRRFGKSDLWLPKRQSLQTGPRRVSDGKPPRFRPSRLLPRLEGPVPGAEIREACQPANDGRVHAPQRRGTLQTDSQPGLL